MSEREIREVLRSVCEDMDRRARRAVRGGVRKVVMPAVLGAGLALGGGCSDDDIDKKQDASVSDGQVKDGAGDGVVPGPDAAYFAPDSIVYMGPDAGPPTPDLGPGNPDLAYMAPPADGFAPDAGPQIDYMAPDAAPKKK